MYLYNNEQVWKVLVRISVEICLKMDYFDSKSLKSAKRLGLRSQTPLPPAASPPDSR